MFDSLSSKLQKVFRHLKGYGKLTEQNIQDALREVRLALLEADVHYKVAKDFVQTVAKGPWPGGDAEPHSGPAGHQDRQ